MEPQPPSSSTPPPPPAAQPPSPPPAGAGSGASAPAPPAAPPPNPEIVICPVCREPRAEDARFCEECGHDYGADPPPPSVPEERPMFSGPILWAIMLFWVALAIGGLFFLYNALWSL